MAESLVLATWAAVSVFVLWLALVSVVRKRVERKSSGRRTSVTDAPEPTAQEILEAQSLGLLPTGPDPGRRSR